jgi:phosphoglycerol transferase MdoB-like AlkP superfamily enzyme
LLFLLPLTGLYANEIEIRYHLPNEKEAMLIWGINDWQYYDKAPKGTERPGKTMRTPMKKEGDDFVVNITIEPGNKIDFTFVVIKPQGPFSIRAEYWNIDKETGKPFFHVDTDSSQVININGAVDYNSPKGTVLFFNYTAFILAICVGMVLISAGFKRYAGKSVQVPVTPAACFVAVTLAFAGGLFFIRLYNEGLVFRSIIQPFGSIPKIASASWGDWMFSGILVLIFGALFLLFKKGTKLIVILYSFLCLLCLLFSFINIKVTEVLGRPLNFQWLYYSDFLNSSDASKAIGENISSDYIWGCVFLLLAVFALVWLGLKAYSKWPGVFVFIFPLLLLLAFWAHLQKPAKGLDGINPVVYFLASITVKANDQAQQAVTTVSEFAQKNTDSIPAAYATAFQSAQIKNVIVFVLESTPAEYITAYNPAIKATPFIQSIRQQAALFENIYAHTPATNKSMFSILCSTYPDFSFKSVTKETPDMPLASITSELKKEQYRTLFLNSGDNRFQNAEGFLKARGFDDLLDFRTNHCGAVFSDKRYSNNMLDGVDDSCLPVRFFNWQQQQPDEPFFAMLWTFQTHYPYFNNGKTIHYNTGNPSLEKYLNGLHRADKALQLLVDGLAKKHLLASTLIVVTGDHGEAFGRHGQTTHASNIYEENLHIPLLLINPLLFKGERLSTLGGISDIAPTIFSVLNKPSPAVWQGESLFSTNRRKTVYFFSPYSDVLFGLREDHYKLIFNATDNVFNFYDLSADKYEEKNIAVEKKEYVKMLNQKLQAWIKYQGAYSAKLVQSATKK